MRKLRIVLIEFTPTGGLFQFSFGLGDAIARRGHDVELVTGDQPELHSQLPNFRVTPLLPSCPSDHPVGQPRFVRLLRRALCGFRYLEGWRRLLKYVDGDGADVIQWGDLRFPLDGWLVALVAKRSPRASHTDVAHTPRPFREHRVVGPLHKSGRLLRHALGMAYAAMDVVFVLGNESRKELVEAWPMVRRVEVISHGDMAALQTREVPPPDVAPPTALFFGTWARHKGLEVLFSAFERVRARLPEATLIVAGPVGGDVDYDRLEGRARTIGGIEMRPGYVPVEDVPDLLGSARVVVAPYLEANQSGVVHLAQTFGRPVIASDVGDLKDAIRDGREGLLVPAGDADALARSLENVLRDERRAAEMGGHGRARIEREASWDMVAATVEKTYLEITRP